MDTDDPVDVVVLASGVNQISLYDGYEPGAKALIPFHGRASIRYVLDAVTATPGIGRICVEGPRDALAAELAPELAAGRVEVADGGESFLASVVLGLEHFRTSRRVLFVTGDLPLLTSDAVTEFLAGIAAADPRGEGRLWVSAVPKDAFTGPYARPTKSFNGYRGMPVCHGNLFAADPRLLEIPGVRDKIDAMYAGRKSAVTTTLALGLDIALVYMFGVEILHLIRLEPMARYVSRRFGFGIVPVVVRRPEITEDVDEAPDYAFVNERLAERLRETPCA